MNTKRCLFSFMSVICFVFDKGLPLPLHCISVSIYVGTGDHSFERRLRLGGPLLKENIATMVLER